jgi:hypothetical protein
MTDRTARRPQDFEAPRGARAREGAVSATSRGRRALERALLRPRHMRTQRIAFGPSVAMLVLASACGSISGMLQNDGGGGQDGGPAACRTLDEASCRARTDCAAGACSLCGGTPAFAGCYDPSHESPPACLAIPCPPTCTGLDETSCRARTDCQAISCPDCNGGSHFVGCAVAGALVDIACPAIACPLPCAQETTKDACDARPDCHSVFVDPGTCGCAAAGCCAHFSACADGAQATCKAPTLLCRIATPYCEAPYVVSYTSNCYEGCVQSTACAP